MVLGAAMIAGIGLMGCILVPYIVEIRGGGRRSSSIRAIGRSGVAAGEGCRRGEWGCSAGIICVLLLGRLAAVFGSRQLLMLDYQ